MQDLPWFSENVRVRTLKKMNFFYFRTIDKQVLQLMLMSLVGTGVSARGSIALTLSGNTFALIGFVMF